MSSEEEESSGSEQEESEDERSDDDGSERTDGSENSASGSEEGSENDETEEDEDSDDDSRSDASDASEKPAQRKLKINVALDRKGNVVDTKVSVEKQEESDEDDEPTKLKKTIAVQTETGKEKTFNPHDKSLTRKELIQRAFEVLLDDDDEEEEYNESQEDRERERQRQQWLAYSIPPMYSEIGTFDDRAIGSRRDGEAGSRYLFDNVNVLTPDMFLPEQSPSSARPAVQLQHHGEEDYMYSHPPSHSFK